MTAELIVDLFVSADGWAGGDGLPAYFGYFGNDLAEWIATEKEVPEVVLMGRRTYDAFCSLPADAWSDDRSHLMGLDKIVCSRHLESVTWPRTRICRDLLAEVQQLKASAPERVRTWGSMSLVSQLLLAREVDRLRVMRFPLLVGDAGRQPAFAEVPRAHLELQGARVLDDRLILEEYQPSHPADPSIAPRNAPRVGE